MEEHALKYQPLLPEFELDPDELDDASQRNLDHARLGSRSATDQSMPLLVGLFDTSASRRSLDASSHPLHDRSGTTDHIDLEELSQKHTAGGGMLDSIANMANSILGAGA